MSDIQGKDLKTEQPERPPGVCVPWQEKLRELPPIQGDPEMVEKVWKDVDALGYIYIWHCLVSF